MFIDSHQHFWQLRRGDYDWLTPNLVELYRDYLPQDLAPTLNQLNIHGTIVVQAAASHDETNYLLNLAEQHSFILGVVGWLDMLADDACDRVAEWMTNPFFCGIRPMLQDMKDTQWVLQANLTPIFKTLELFGCNFDALVRPQHLPALITLLERHPDLHLVIDHGGKPNIKFAEFEPWATHMKELSNFPNVYCKFSGLLTECDPNQSYHQIFPYADHLFSCFGFERMMWGSDYPVVKLASDYQQWFTIAQLYVNQLGPKAYEAVFGKVAAQFYLNGRYPFGF